MVTLAAIALGIQPSGAVFAQPNGTANTDVPTTPLSSTCTATGTEIIVDEQTTTLDAAYQAAKAQLVGCADEQRVIELVLTTPGPHILPLEINVEGTIRIVSKLQDGTRASLQRSNPNREIAVRSPLELDGVELQGNRTFFSPQASLTINNSRFVGDASGPFGNVSIAVYVAHGGQPMSVEITNSTFDDIAPLVVAQTTGPVRFANNTVRTENLKSLTLVASTAQTSDDPFIIEHNTFTVSANHAQPNVMISGSRVTVRRNTFLTDGDVANITYGEPIVGNGQPPIHHIQILPDAQASGQGGQTGHPLDQIRIEQNTFSGIAAIGYYTRLPQTFINPGGVVVSRNNFADAKAPFPKVVDYDREAFDFACNYWGNHDSKQTVALNTNLVLRTDDLSAGECIDLDKKPEPAPPAPAPLPPVKPTPSEPVKPVVPIEGPTQRISGDTRFETAVAAAKEQFPQGSVSKTVIMARGDVAADSVSAVPLAKAINAPILLTPSDQLHVSLGQEIKRLVGDDGSVIIMGGPEAITPEVETAVRNLGFRVTRLAGHNRAATAVETAKYLEANGNLTHVYLADGNDWQADLITGPIAAKTQGVTLLTNGEHLAPETKAFLDAHPQIQVTAIGDKASNTGVTTRRITGNDATDLSLAVAKTFFDTSTEIGVATSQEFADALVGGAHVSHEGGALVLVEGEDATRVNNYLKERSTISRVFVYGGRERLSTANDREVSFN
ncbi:cell wall-binding repeat-containing protein [Stomatohabitans albus]|uniref:cell wall-binding repeat-containing protein n=1 Tax=Stomatohabitans albus TaxID=3110766 RepID=UPI00300C7E5A